MPVRTEDLDEAIAEVIGTFDGVELGNKCGTKRGHFKLYAKERHIGGLAVWLWKITPVPVTTWHMQCVKKGSVGNTRLLPCAKMLLVPMNFFSNG